MRLFGHLYIFFSEVSGSSILPIVKLGGAFFINEFKFSFEWSLLSYIQLPTGHIKLNILLLSPTPHLKSNLYFSSWEPELSIAVNHITNTLSSCLL